MIDIRNIPIFTAILVMVSGQSAWATSAAHPRQADRRIAHARELMGPYYDSSVVRKGEKIKDIRSQVYSWTREAMTGKARKHAKRVAQAILQESERYGFDPIFLMALIENESGFNPNIRGDAGEIGLMQILPSTAKWLKDQNGWKWKSTEKALLDPVMNIRIGANYINYLRKHFDSHGRLYLSAYNMGPTNVNRALSRQTWPREYSMKVMEIYIGYYKELRKRSS